MKTKKTLICENNIETYPIFFLGFVTGLLVFGGLISMVWVYNTHQCFYDQADEILETMEASMQSTTNTSTPIFRIENPNEGVVKLNMKISNRLLNNHISQWKSWLRC